MKTRAILAYGLAWGITGIVLGICSSLPKPLPETIMDQAMLATFLLGGASAAFIVPHSRQQSGVRGIGLEIGQGVLLWAGWIIVGLSLDAFIRYIAILPLDRWDILFLILSFFPGLAVYETVYWFRKLWQRWTHLRKTRFLWTMTNAQLVVVTSLVFLLDLIAVLSSFRRGNFSAFLLITTPEIPPALGWLLQIVIWLGALAALLGISVLLALPASALFSFWIAKRQTHRLEALTRTANLLRKGNYAARVTVEGQDELAQLQTAFNQMSAELEQALRSLKDERDKVNSLLQIQRDLTANVSHDLRTPLTLLHGSIETEMELQAADSHTNVSKRLDVMLQQVQQLEVLVADLLTLSQAQANQLSIRVETIAPAAIIQHVVDATAPYAWKMRRVKVYAELPEIIANVRADAHRLEQVLQNLIQNGVNHTAPGGFVAVAVVDEPDEVRLDVIDSGEGIPKRELDHIWERYYRGNSNQTGGVGLGLAIVKGLVVTMQGRVSVESTPGEGSQFSVFLPKAAI